MNSRRLLASLAFALLCSGLLTWQMSRHMIHAAPSALVPPSRHLIVAGRDLKAGEALTPSSLRTATLSASQPLPGTFDRPEQLSARVLLVPLTSGEPVTEHDLAAVGVSAGLAAMIPDGMRAVTLPVADISTANGAAALKPGSRVDVLVSYRSDREARFVSSLVLQNIPVLASDTPRPIEGKSANAGPRAADTLQLLVTSEEAARLSVASCLGKLTFALRNGRDKTLSAGLSHVTLTLPEQGPGRASALAPPERVASREAPKGFTVETLSGDKLSTQTFSDGQP